MILLHWVFIWSDNSLWNNFVDMFFFCFYICVFIAVCMSICT